MDYQGALLQIETQGLLDIFWWHYKKLGSDLLYNLTCHPKLDGQTEVVNKNLKNLLISLSGENPNQWDFALAQAKFAYNILVNITTEKSPSHTIYGILSIGVVDFIAFPYLVN